ncbi:MAG: hypothetical protein EXS03_04260 [Phycisphaerales bacterium]|nr:hypothetical protein [Phycisphaerales bacterium]
MSALARPDWRQHKAVVVLAAIWLTVPAIMGVMLVAELGLVGQWLRERDGAAIVIFAGCFAVTTGLGLLPPYAQTILGGWVFGAVEGTMAVTAGLVVGAAIGWSVARLASGPRVVAWLDASPKSRVIRAALVDASQRRTFLLILLLRLPPNSPFAAANLAMGASGVRLVPVVAATGLGMLPRTAALCTAAAAAAATGAEDIQSLLAQQGWMWFGIGLACLIVALAVISAIAKRALASAGLAPPQP